MILVDLKLEKFRIFFAKFRNYKNQFFIALAVC